LWGLDRRLRPTFLAAQQPHDQVDYHCEHDAGEKATDYREVDCNAIPPPQEVAGEAAREGEMKPAGEEDQSPENDQNNPDGDDGSAN